MNRPDRVRKVYGELRRALGDQFPSHEILRTAARLVDIFDDRKGYSGIRHGAPRPTFEELPLDKAFADGGWRILSRESNQFAELYSEDPRDLTVRRKLRSLGMELAA